MDILDTRHKTVLDNLFDGVYAIDRNHRIVYWNPAAERITGYSAAEVTGRQCADNILNHLDNNGNCLCDGFCPLAHVMADGQLRDSQIFLHHRAGHRMPVRIRAVPLRNDAGAIVGSIEIFRETRSQEALQDRLADLEKLALLDTLTQLPNRRYAQTRLEAGLSLFAQTRQPIGILYIDIDNFKAFNDNHGHAIGDQALQTVAKTLINTIRPQDTIARWGGEEFIGIFPNIDKEALHVIANRLCALVRATSVETPGASLPLTVSIGGATARAGDTAESLVNRADAMMYQGKQTGRDRFVIEA